METWPPSFPMLSSSAYSGDQAANTVRTTMDSGSIRQRRRFSVEILTLSCTWELSDTEFGIFCAFVKYRLNLGADWFLMNLPAGGDDVQLHQVRFQNGNFKQTYTDVGFWDVQATLDVMQRMIISETVLDFYLATGFSDNERQNLIDAFNAFHNSVHVTSPANLN